MLLCEGNEKLYQLFPNVILPITFRFVQLQYCTEKWKQTYSNWRYFPLIIINRWIMAGIRPNPCADQNECSKWAATSSCLFGLINSRRFSNDRVSWHYFTYYPNLNTLLSAGNTSPVWRKYAFDFMRNIEIIHIKGLKITRHSTTLDFNGVTSMENSSIVCQIRKIEEMSLHNVARMANANYLWHWRIQTLWKVLHRFSMSKFFVEFLLRPDSQSWFHASQQKAGIENNCRLLAEKHE